MFWTYGSDELGRAEEAEIARLKWLESEKRGHDIGIYYAEWLWLTRHRAAWLAAIRATGVSGHQVSGSQT